METDSDLKDTAGRGPDGFGSWDFFTNAILERPGRTPEQCSSSSSSSSSSGSSSCSAAASTGVFLEQRVQGSKTTNFQRSGVELLLWMLHPLKLQGSRDSSSETPPTAKPCRSPGMGRRDCSPHHLCPAAPLLLRG
ncbi:hypothetical protein E2320_011929 [Naja naja]|nr:hypothetical protein E2320_011929 [Naja naja]